MKILLLNLDRSTDRLSYFQSINRHLSEVERITAVDGRQLERRKLTEEGILSTFDLKYTAGALGCSLSHIGLWKMAVAENRSLTVSEDDVIFSYFFEERSQHLLRSIDPDWDFILWGWALECYLWTQVLSGGIISEIRLLESTDQLNLIDDFQITRRPTVLLPLIHCMGFQCYSISPSGAKKLLQRCLPLRNEIIHLRHSGIRLANTCVDVIANDAYPTMKAYACLSALATVNHTNPSTILND